MDTTEQLTRDLADVNLARSDDDIAQAARDLVRRARVTRDALGPVMRSPVAAGRADDHEATFQFAIAIGHDGILRTAERVDAPQYALIPLIAAMRHRAAKIEHGLADQLKMTPQELERWVKPLLDGMEDDDFQAKWQTIKKNIPGSRTQGSGKIIVPSSSPLHQG